MLHYVIDHFFLKEVSYSDKRCSKQLLNEEYIIKVKGKYTLNTKDAQQVEQTYHFCPSTKYFTNSKECSNQVIPKFKENVIIVVDLTMIKITSAEKALLCNLNLLCIESE